jgi:predicted phosphodiesterase
MSMILVLSMVVSLIVVALPQPEPPTPTPLPTWTPLPLPSDTPSPSPSPEPSPTPEATEPPIGPELPTDTPEATEPPVGPELPTDTPTVTPTLTATPSSTGPDLIFAVCGDSRGNPKVYRRVLASVDASDSQFLLHTGDLVNQGTEEQWQAFREMMVGFDLPFYPVPGNHDGLEGRLDGYLEYSGAPAAHYSFDRGPVHFALADSHNGGIGAAELTWLRQDLSATVQPLKVVLLHHPPFDPDGTDHIMAYGNEGFMLLMAEQGVDYVFAGHIHAYAQEERDGVTYVITGGAGAPLYSQDHPQAFYHYLQATVKGETLSVEVIQV